MTSMNYWKDVFVKENEFEKFQKFRTMIAKCLAPLCVHNPRCWHKFFVVKFLFQSFNEIMSLSFNHVYAQALFIFLREFSYKNSRVHLWSLAWSHLISCTKIHFPIGVLKDWSGILIPKIIWCLFKNHIFNILLVEWQVN